MAACAELAGKLGSGIPEVRDRALRSLSSKLEGGLLPLEVAAGVRGLPQRVLHWINDRQAAAPPELVRLALRLLATLARSPAAALGLREAGCAPFLQAFRPNAGALRREVDEALAALLVHPVEAPRPAAGQWKHGLPLEGASALGGPSSAPPPVRAPAPLAPARTPPSAAMSPARPCANASPGAELAAGAAPCAAAALGALAEADLQQLLDLGVRLKFGDGETLRAACVDLCDLACDVPPATLLAHGPLVDGLRRALQGCGAAGPTGGAPVKALRALLGHLEDDDDGPAAAVCGCFRELLAGLQGSAASVSGPLLAQTLAALRRGLPRCRGAGPELLACAVASAGALTGRLAAEGGPCETWSVGEALQRCGGRAAGAAPPAPSPWREPLLAHGWCLGRLALADAFLELLQAAGEAGSEGLAAEADLSRLAAHLLLDYRFLCERPGAVDVLLPCARAACEEDSRDFELFRDLLASAVEPVTALGDADDTGEKMARLPRLARTLEHKLRLVMLDDAMRPKHLVRDAVCLVAEVAHHGRCTPGHTLLPSLQHSCAALCCKLAVCPDAATVDAFFATLEREPEAGWLFARQDFVSTCVDGGQERAMQCLVRWRQGDCAAEAGGSGLSQELLELLEAACLDAPTSTAASSLRRLFAAPAWATPREDAALLLWRGLAQGGARASRFLSDPVASVQPVAEAALRGYRISGLRATAQDVEQLLGILSNARLAWEVRTTACVQLSTFLVSDSARTVALLEETSRSLPLTALEALRSAPPAAGEGAAGAEEFLTRLCHASTVLLLLRAGPAQQLRAHRSALLDHLMPWAFHTSEGLRCAALQLGACLLFDPALMLPDRPSCHPAGELVGLQERGAGPPALAVPSWVAANYLLPLELEVVKPVSSTSSFWGVPLRGRTVALCQVFHRLQKQGWDPLCVGSASARSAPSTGTGRSPVFELAEGRIAAAGSLEELLALVCPLALTPPAGVRLLRCHSYLRRLLAELAQPPASAEAGSTALTAAQRSGAIEQRIRLLEHVHALLEALPAGPCDRGALEQLAAAVAGRVLPTAWELVVGWSTASDVPEAVVRRAHGALAVDAGLRSLVELVLRLGISLAGRVEISGQWLAAKEWVVPLTALASSGTQTLRRLALAAAALIVCVPGVPADCALRQLHAVVLERLAVPAASCTSLRHSFELTAALWLVAQARPADIAPLAEVAACVIPWASHCKAAVGALAWRAQRALLLAHSRPEEGRTADWQAAGLRALRALGAPRPERPGAGDDDELVHAEAMELLRLALITAACADGAGCQDALVAQVLKAGLLSRETMRRSLQGRRRGSRRTAVRLLAALAAADHAVNEALVQRGIWQQAIAAARCSAGGDVLLDDALDTAALMGDIAEMAGAAAARDPQMLLWFVTSTDLLPNWQDAMVNFLAATEGAPPVPGGTMARVLMTHLRALRDVARVMRRQLTPPLHDDPVAQAPWADAASFLFSPAVLLLLSRGLHERLPGAQQTAAAAVATLYGLPLLGLDTAHVSAPEHLEVELGRRGCLFFAWAASQPGSASGGAGQGPLHAATACLTNLLGVSRAAGAAARRAGLATTLAEHVAAAAAAVPEPTLALARRKASVASLCGALRLLSALLAASEGLADAGPGEAPELATVLLATRAAAEKEDAVSLEVLELLSCCAHTERRAGRAGAGSETLASMLLRLDLVPWLLRLSQRHQGASAVYCKIMSTLSLLAPALSGKPVMLRFLSQISENIRSNCRGWSREPVHAAAATASEQSDEWRARRAAAAMHFAASLRPCARGSEALLGGPPPARSPEDAALPGALGLDFWLDLVEPESRAPVAVRAASMRLLLAVASGTSPHAKAYFLRNSRAVPLLLRLLRGAQELRALALNLLWVVAHNHQRALPTLRRLRVMDAVHAAAAASSASDAPEGSRSANEVGSQKSRVRATLTITGFVSVRFVSHRHGSCWQTMRTKATLST